ncbi:hypothetical protein RHMOL_Rhmol09G0223300 [Rhododendron molle]|uniref:Uncharacterized protein n=1 Tax=Rhododendron molle TaxID=49168 RepID=A0ACC0MG49_RHOML|nr:hypothetical protein RHMOL_Rhmol09G0223300 [Rhododendron molle]
MENELETTLDRVIAPRRIVTHHESDTDLAFSQPPSPLISFLTRSPKRMAICSVGLGFHQFIGTGLGSGEIRKTRLGSGRMINDEDLGFFANFLGIFIFLLVIAYHYVMADPKYEGS